MRCVIALLFFIAGTGTIGAKTCERLDKVEDILNGDPHAAEAYMNEYFERVTVLDVVKDAFLRLINSWKWVHDLKQVFVRTGR